MTTPRTTVQRTGTQVTTAQRLVLDAATELLERSGFHGVTIEAVARMSGVSKSTIYRHWSDKSALILDAYTVRASTDTAVADTGDVRADLEAYLAKLAFGLNFHKAATIVTDLVAETLRNPDFALRFRTTLLSQSRGSFLAIFLRAQRRGQISTDADLETVIDAAYGAIHHRLLISGRAIDGDFVRRLTSIILDGIRLPPSC